MAPGLAAIRSAGPFAAWLRDAVINFKYHDEWARADHLGRDLTRTVADMDDLDVLTPVPLHRSRLRERGYNQSALLANVVGDQLGLPVVDALLRTRSTKQQALLSAGDRAENVDGAFAIAPGFNVAGRRIVLIDDVITSGSTINACARILVDHGAATVRAATLARQL